MDFLRNLYDNYEKQLSDTGLDDLKAATKKAVYKKKITYEIEKQKSIPNENPRNVGSIIIPSNKREEILNESRQVLLNGTQ